MSYHGCLYCGAPCDGDVCDTLCALRLDRQREADAVFAAWKATGLPMCENYDTDEEVSACSTPYDRIARFSPTGPYLCDSCADHRHELEERLAAESYPLVQEVDS